MAISSALGSAGAVPVGVVNPFAGATAPSGWLLCYGQAVSRTQYPVLFNTLSTTYGSGDGSTTFNIPDMRGRAVVGKDDMGGTAASRITNAVSGITATTLGAVGGNQVVQEHTHTFTGTASTTGNDNTDHTHSYQTVYNTSAVMAAGSSYYVYYPTSTSTGGRSAFHQHSFTPAGTNSNFPATAGGQSQNVQPTIILNYIIKAQ